MKRKNDRAVYYEAHRGDVDLWEESEGIEEATDLQRKRGLTATITVRFSAEEAETIRHVARESGLTYSQVVRKAVRAFTRPQVAITSGGPFNFIQSYDSTRATRGTAVFEPSQDPGSSTRTGHPSSAVPSRE